MIILLGIRANQSNNIVRIFGYSYSVVASDSMEPTFEVGEIITSKAISIEDVEKGDIIVFWSEEYQVHIVHRVIEVKEGNKLVTKGDNPQAGVDSNYVNDETLHGVVVRHGNFLNLGKLILDYRDVVYVVIILLFIYIIVTEIISIIRNLKKAKEEELKKEKELNKQKIYDEEKARMKEELEKGLREK